MYIETPDKWTILKVCQGFKETIYKIMAGWNGGYLGADEWRINSGIASYEDCDDHYLFHGYSGSVYQCYKGREGFTSLSQSVYRRFVSESQGTDTTIEQITVEDYVKSQPSIRSTS